MDAVIHVGNTDCLTECSTSSTDVVCSNCVTAELPGLSNLGFELSEKLFKCITCAVSVAEVVAECIGKETWTETYDCIVASVGDTDCMECATSAICKLKPSFCQNSISDFGDARVLRYPNIVVQNSMSRELGEVKADLIACRDEEDTNIPPCTCSRSMYRGACLVRRFICNIFEYLSVISFFMF